jgi:hypothetical protein
MVKWGVSEKVSFVFVFVLVFPCFLSRLRKVLIFCKTKTQRSNGCSVSVCREYSFYRYYRYSSFTLITKVLQYEDSYDTASRMYCVLMRHNSGNVRTVAKTERVSQSHSVSHTIIL